MNQYAITIRTEGYEVYLGSSFGDSHEVREEANEVRIDILNSDKVAFTCLCEDVEIAKEGNTFDVYIYKQASNY